MTAAPASSPVAALALPYGATRTAVAALSTTAMGRARCCHSATPSVPVTKAITTSTTGQRARRRVSTAAQASHHASVAATHHAAGVAGPTASSDSLAPSGGGGRRRARRTTALRGARRAAIVHAVVALPSAPARYSVAPRSYQWAATRGSVAARAANESAAARSAPASYRASALGRWARTGAASPSKQPPPANVTRRGRAPTTPSPRTPCP